MLQQLDSRTNEVSDTSINDITSQLFYNGAIEMVERLESYHKIIPESQSNSSLNESKEVCLQELHNRLRSVGFLDSVFVSKNVEMRYSDFTTKKEIGSGSYGEVDKVVHKQFHEVMAIKSMRLEEEEEAQQNLCRELNAMRFTDLPCFLDFYGATINGTKIVMLMEYMDLGSLEAVQKELGGTVSEAILGKVGYSVLTGLQYLHKKLRMVHRDIKPSNILLNSKGEVKLTDFGVCGYLDDTGFIRSSWLGTKLYMSISFTHCSVISFTPP